MLPIAFGMVVRMLAAGVALVMLGGCGTGLSFAGKQAEATVGWYCVDNVKTGIKDCEKRLLRNGIPVDDVVYERLGAAEPPVSESALPASRQSPLTVINALDDGGGLEVENQGPAPREVRSYVDRSGKTGEPAQNGEM